MEFNWKIILAIVLLILIISGVVYYIYYQPMVVQEDEPITEFDIVENEKPNKTLNTYIDEQEEISQ